MGILRYLFRVCTYILGVRIENEVRLGTLPDAVLTDPEAVIDIW